MRAKLFISMSALVAMLWAVSSAGTAPFIVSAAAQRPVDVAPRPARLSVERERGLLLDVWLNGKGPYVFAVDTGAGGNLITQRVVSDSQLTTNQVPFTRISGLTAASTSSTREAIMPRIALGDPGNHLSSQKTALVVATLPNGVDGILDPTDVYAPFGYSIDMPNRSIEAVNVTGNLSPRSRPNVEGATVPWLRSGNSDRPFVKLGDGRLALVDTGSRFGLAVNSRDAVIVGPRGTRSPNQGTQDISGGNVNSRRVAPTTVSIGELVLRGVPTDILFGIEDDAPVILGRDVLYPFKITFDPRKRLIEFATSERG
jgi:Aspartyl protease